MQSQVLSWAGLTLLAAHAAGQTVLYGVQSNGDLLRIDPATGAGVLIGSSGIACITAAAYNRVLIPGDPGGDESVLIGGGPEVHADQISALNRWTGAAWWTLNTTGRPLEHGIRGMALDGPGTGLYVVLGTEQTTTVELLARIDRTTGAYTVLGPTGRTDIEALAVSPSTSALYALGTDGGGNLYTLDTSTGAATLVGGGGFGGDSRALAFLPDGNLLACGANLLSVDRSTGATTLIGPTGFTDIRGLAALNRAGCYANCSYCPPGTWCQPPLLNVLDFNCFVVRFAAGNPYANCDQSTTPPVLNVLDFLCFLNKFSSAAGCT